MDKLIYIRGLFSAILLSFSMISFAQSSGLELLKGGVAHFSVNKNIATIFISAPDIADYQVIDSNHFVVYGKDVGRSSLSVFDDEGNIILSRSFQVKDDYTPIIDMVKTEYPNANIKLQFFQNRVLLSGVVSSESEKDSIYRLVGEILGLDLESESLQYTDSGGNAVGMKMEHMTRYTYSGLMNRLRVSATKQVNVKMTVAEVSRTYLENLGINIGEFVSGELSNGYFLNTINDFSSSDIYAVIQANGTNTDSQILAQPNLTVLSGESARFLLGGEYPYIVSSDDEVSVEFKEWGISLDIAAKVLSDQQIRINVAPEVSYIQEDIYGSNYPTIETRRIQTTIELGDGQSFVLAGLLKEQDRDTLSKVPFIGDIPVLGALFRSTSTSREQTELVIVATVNLVQPIKENLIQLPSMKRIPSLSRFFNLPERTSRQLPSKKVEDILVSGGFKQ